MTNEQLQKRLIKLGDLINKELNKGREQPIPFVLLVWPNVHNTLYVSNGYQEDVIRVLRRFVDDLEAIHEADQQDPDQDMRRH